MFIYVRMSSPFGKCKYDMGFLMVKSSINDDILYNGRLWGYIIRHDQHIYLMIQLKIG